MNPTHDLMDTMCNMFADSLEQSKENNEGDHTCKSMDINKWWKRHQNKHHKPVRIGKWIIREDQLDGGYWIVIHDDHTYPIARFVWKDDAIKFAERCLPH